MGFTKIVIENIKIDKLIRSKRRTMDVEVRTDATLTVRVPLRCSNRRIQEFIEEQRGWILDRQNYAREHCKQIPPKKFVDGEEFLYLGKSYSLVYTESGYSTLAFDGEKFLLNANHSKEARDLFIQWYKNEADKIIADRAKWYSSEMKTKFQKIRVSNARSQFGYCGSNGNLTFSWTLIMAPLVVIDCVIVHELLHLRVRGHSKDFWNGVGLFIPEVDYCRNWLKVNQNELSIFNSSN